MISSSLCLSSLLSMLSLQASASSIPPQRATFTIEDSFQRSNLSYEDWGNKMVAEGKMYWAPVSALQKRDDYTVEKFICGYIAGPTDGTYTATRDEFCGFLSQQATTAAAGVEDIARNKICADGVVCNLVFAATAAGANNLLYRDLNNVCQDAYDQVSNVCQTLYGGYATITFADGSSGSIGGQYFDPSEATGCPDGYNCEQT